jgi:hypothetical protein
MDRCRNNCRNETRRGRYFCAVCRALWDASPERAHSRASSSMNVTITALADFVRRMDAERRNDRPEVAS